MKSVGKSSQDMFYLDRWCLIAFNLKLTRRSSRIEDIDLKIHLETTLATNMSRNLVKKIKRRHVCKYKKNFPEQSGNNRVCGAGISWHGFWQRKHHPKGRNCCFGVKNGNSKIERAKIPSRAKTRIPEREK